MTFRVHVSVDLEGVAGVATLDQIIRGGSGYPRAQVLMTEEANAAIRGAFEGGASEVVVEDSHGTMDNLLPELLDPRATLVHGLPRAACMVDGVAAGTGLAVMVGYHAPAGQPGVLAHTFSTAFTEVRLGGRPVSEAEANALHVWAAGVPVGVLSGDDAICHLAAGALPGVSVVRTKDQRGFSAAESVHPSRARSALEESVAQAVSEAKAGRAPEVPAVPEELELEVDLSLPLMADLATCVPGTRRLGGRTVAHTLRSTTELMGCLTAWYHLAATGSAQLAMLAMRR